MVKIFVSGTSRDLRSYREAVSEVLQSNGIEPDEQQYFGPDHRVLYDLLRDKIADCDAVIALVGLAYGAAPAEAEGPLRSYTQLEYDKARQFGKPTYVFITTDDCPLDAPPLDEPHEAAIQMEHRRAIADGPYLWEPLSNHDGLRERVDQLSRKLAGGSRRLSCRVLHPVAPPAFFAGRDRELKQLNESLEPGGGSVVVVLGVGGQGKTTLVERWWRQNRQVGDLVSHFEAAFWCSAYRAGFAFDSFVDAMLSYLLRGKYDKRVIPEIEDRVEKLIGLLQQRRVLMVIDGIERWLAGWNEGEGDPLRATRRSQRRGFFDGLDTFLLQVSGLTNGTRLVLTTRALPAALDETRPVLIPLVEGSHEITTLEGLDDVASAQLLSELGVKGSEDQRIAMANEYGNHPLALVVLGKLLDEHFAGRLEHLEGVSALDPRLRLFELLEETRSHLPGGAVADRFLQVVAHCEENALLSVVAAGLDEPSDSETISQLRNHAVILHKWQLVTWDADRQVVRMHPLVKEYFSSCASDSATIHRRIFRSYFQETIPDEASTREQVRARLLALHHALSAGELETAAALFFGRLTNRYTFVTWLTAWGHLDEARDLAETLAHNAQGALRAELLSVLSTMLRQLGQVDKARSAIDEAIEVLSGVSSDSPEAQRLSLSGAWNNRGNINFQRRRHSESLDDFNRSIEILLDLDQTGIHSPGQLANTLSNRANTLLNLGELTRSIHDFDRAIQIYEEMIDDGNQAMASSLATAMAGRGNAYSERREFTKGSEDFDRAFHIIRQLVDDGQVEQERHIAHLHVARAGALTVQERGAEAVGELNHAIPLLARLVESGRSELEHSLGLAFLDRSLAYQLAENAEAALTDSDRAVSIFRRLVSSGREDVRGWLSHGLARRSELLTLMDDEESIAVQEEAYSLMRQLINETGSMMLRNVLLRTGVRIASAALPSDPQRATLLLREVFSEAEQLIKSGGAAEIFLINVQVVVQRVEARRQEWEHAGIDGAILESWRRLTETQRGK